jgi:hypothetical protein
MAGHDEGPAALNGPPLPMEMAEKSSFNRATFGASRPSP